MGDIASVDYFVAAAPRNDMGDETHHNYWVYILANKRNGTLYTGVTGKLRQRVWEHKQHRREGFTAKYDVTRLVYFECFREIRYAIRREKQIKGGSRQKKIDLIERLNPEWRDLSTNWYGKS